MLGGQDFFFGVTGERIPTNILPESLADSINLGGFGNCYIGKTLGAFGADCWSQC